MVTEFKAAFPEFADADDSVITFWLEIAKDLVSERRLGGLYKRVLFLYVAHKMALHVQNEKAIAGGQAGFTDGGVAMTKKVGELSVTYRSNAAYENAGEFALTSYGRAYWDIVWLFGAGCKQL